jgi:hypothetical protein
MWFSSKRTTRSRPKPKISTGNPGEAEGSAVRHSGAPNLSFYNPFPFVILEEDTATTRPVAVINEAFARRFFKNENPLGKHFERFVPRDSWSDRTGALRK